MANDQEHGIPTLAQEARRRKSLDRVHSGLISVPLAEKRSHRRLPRDFDFREVCEPSHKQSDAGG